MKLKELFVENRRKYLNLVRLRTGVKKENAKTCPVCQGECKVSVLEKNRYMCPDCGHLFPMPPRDRIRLICDANAFREIGKDLASKDPLNFPEYAAKLSSLQAKTGSRDAVVTGVGLIRHMPAAIGVMDAGFMMGSMGTVVGEKISALTELAGKRGLPLILFTASGGARMQEGLFSLMQMAKTAAAVERFRQSGGLFISVLTDPTCGGVSASFAFLGDIVLAEPEALICFAGPRVIEQTIGRKLPAGFQRAEFLQDHGMVDAIVSRRDQKALLGDLLRLHRQKGEKNLGGKGSGLRKSDKGKGTDKASH